MEMTETTTSPPTAIPPWPGPVAHDIRQPVPIGIDADGTPIRFPFAGRHTLYTGAVASGTSTALRVAAASLAPMANTVLWGIDMTILAELDEITPALDRVATGTTPVRDMLHTLATLMHERAQLLPEPAPWDPAVHGPVLVLLVNEPREFYRLGRPALEHWRSLLAFGDRLGISILAVSHDLNWRTLGGVSPRAAGFTNVACFGHSRPSIPASIVGPRARLDGWRTDEESLPLPGMFLPYSPEYTSPRVARGYWPGPRRRPVREQFGL